MRPSVAAIANPSRLLLIALELAVVSLSGATVVGQSLSLQPSAMIEGSVRNVAGKPVPDSTVLLQQKGDSKTIETKTKADGTFVFSALRAGVYSVTAVKSGLRNAVTDPVALLAGEKKHLTLILEYSGTAGAVAPVPSSSSSSVPSSAAAM